MALRVSCFGKLPFHREFLRLGLETAAARWVVEWLEAAHTAWTRGGGAPETSPLVRFAVPAGEGLVVGVARQSSDGLRRHPVTLFVEDARPVAAEVRHLVPLGCAGTWETLSALLARPFTSAGDLGAALAPGALAPDLGPAEGAYASFVGRPMADAVGAVAGGGADAARHLMYNVVAAARAQREARSRAEGVGVALPLPPDAADAAAWAALWVAVFAAAAGPSAGQPALFVGDAPARVVALYRPPEGRDLAAVLSSLEMAAIDDLAEPWQPWPPSDRAVAEAIERLAADRTMALGALPARLGAVAGG